MFYIHSYLSFADLTYYFYALLFYKELVKREPTSSILYPLIYSLNQIAVYGLRPQVNFNNYEDMCL